MEAELKELLDSAGPAVVAMDLEGQMIYCNSAAERLLGYNAAELVIPWGKAEILAPGEGDRLLAEMQKVCRVNQAPALTSAAAGLPISIACVNARGRQSGALPVDFEDPVVVERQERGVNTPVLAGQRPPVSETWE